METGEASRKAAERGRNVRFCGLPLTIDVTVEDVIARTFDSPADRPLLTTFVNPGAVHMARSRPDYQATLARFDLVLPDGIGIVWGWRALHREPLRRISFGSTSLALPILRRAKADGRRVMLIGGRPGVADAAATALRAAVPGVAFCKTHHGYDAFAAYEALVRAERPDVVICGMGLPLQEALLVALRDSGCLTGPAFTCGGYFDQLHEGLHYYPRIVGRLNLRWLYRLYREPRRLWRRYLLEYPEYGAALAQEFFRRPTGTSPVGPNAEGTL